MSPRFAWFVLAALLTAPSAAAGDEPAAQESGEGHEEFLHGRLAASSTTDWPVCAPLLIATNFTVFPYVFAGINYSCIPPILPSGSLVGSGGDITLRLA